MVDITITTLEPATSFSFLTLEEAKIMLGIPSGDVAGDAELQILIDQNAAVISELCNRVFAREKVRESWRYLGGERIFLSHWPVKAADIESVVAGGLTIAPADYELEEYSGKLTHFGGWLEPVVVTYTGGYELPEEAPLPLKQASVVLVRQSRTEAAQASTSGVRMIAHKDSRIMFFPTVEGGSSTSSSSGNGAQAQAVNRLLTHYMRFSV